MNRDQWIARCEHPRNHARARLEFRIGEIIGFTLVMLMLYLVCVFLFSM